MKQGYLFINVLQLFPMGVGKTDDFLIQKRKMTAQANVSALFSKLSMDANV